VQLVDSTRRERIVKENSQTLYAASQQDSLGLHTSTRVMHMYQGLFITAFSSTSDAQTIPNPRVVGRFYPNELCLGQIIEKTGG
jgi:hypothetical protein